MLYINEQCNCGAKLELEIQPAHHDMFSTLVAEWRVNHAAYHIEAQKSVPDWRDQHVNGLCTVCKQPMAKITEITTVNSRPIHAGCRNCAMCLRRTGTLLWADKFDIDEDILLHSKCAQVRKEAVEAESNAQQMGVVFDGITSG